MNCSGAIREGRRALSSSFEVCCCGLGEGGCCGGDVFVVVGDGRGRAWWPD
jgi:hypothetical protein